MTKLKLTLTAVTAALVLGACGRTDPTADTGAAALGATSGKKKIVEPTPNPASACTALYSGAQAAATTTDAVVDPSLSYDGRVRTLILSFNLEDAIAPAMNFLQTTLRLKPGDGLGALSNLPMIAVKVPVTRAVVGTLKAGLQGLGLLSIYQDRPLRYFLDQSNAYIQADAAREAFNTTGKGVGVAVIDSGIDGTHGDFPTLVKNVKVVAPIVDAGVGGALYVDAANTDLASGHGTHVAGTIAGSGARSGGKYRGVAPGAHLVGVGAGEAISILFSVQAFDFVLDPDVRETYNVRVISNSWGTSGSRFAPYNPISVASKRAYDLGMIVTFAAGNDGPADDTLNPYSASPCVISVAAGHAKNTMDAANPLVTKGLPGQLADFSSRGVPGDALHHPDITLPGVNIVAPRATTGVVTDPYLGLDGASPEPFYSSISGTSMATPHMSGVAALMLEVNPALNLDGVLAAVTSTANPMYAEDESGATRTLALHEAGAGYANAYAAVAKAAATAGTRTTVTTSPLETWTGTVATTVVAPVADVTVTAAEDNRTLTVPAGASALRVRTDWGNPAYDLDLYVYGPDGQLVASSAQGASASEAVAIPAPAAGTYRVQLKGYLNPQTSYTGTAEIDRVVPLQ